MLEEMRLFISDNMSGRWSNQFPSVAAEYMEVKNSTFPMQVVGHVLVYSKKTKYWL